eukprot:1145262-Pelagomonas_calceolata.AAC.5
MSVEMALVASSLPQREITGCMGDMMRGLPVPKFLGTLSPFALPICTQVPDGKGGVVHKALKLLSEDPAHYPDAPREGIRRVLEQV